MKRGSKTGVRSSMFVAVVLLALIISPMIAGASGSTFQALSPTSSHFGKTYSGWSAAWWQWVLSIPTPQSPLYDETGANCGSGQSGDVWFLAGTFTNNFTPSGDVYGAAQRKCSIPAGKAIFFPIMNTECSTIEPQFGGKMRPCADGIIDGVSAVSATIDGAPVEGLKVDSAFRVAAGPFWFTLPQDNVLQAVYGPDFSFPAGSYKTSSDGYWVLLPPLSSGSHTVRFQGATPLTPSTSFYLDITYQLKVAK